MVISISVFLLFGIVYIFHFWDGDSKQAENSEPVLVNYWEMFAEISKKRTFVEEASAHYRIPVFTPELQDLSGKDIALRGYYLPYSTVDSVIIISRFPYASCFFCGRAGIESVAMVELVRPTLAFVLQDAVVQEQ